VSVATFIAIYFIVWWTILFAVLPWGMRPQAEEGVVVPGTEPGSPVKPMLVKKAIATSIVAALIVFALWLAGRLGVSLDAIAAYFSPPPQ